MKPLCHLPLLVGLLFAGCATNPTLTSTPPASENPFTALEKNLTASQVKALVGQPLKVNPFKVSGLAAGGPSSEIWVYHRMVAKNTAPIPTGTKEVPYIDPITQVMRTIKEPVYSTETITVIEIFELLMIEDRLIEWKSHRETERHII